MYLYHNCKEKLVMNLLTAIMGVQVHWLRIWRTTNVHKGPTQS